MCSGPLQFNPSLEKLRKAAGSPHIIHQYMKDNRLNDGAIHKSQQKVRKTSSKSPTPVGGMPRQNSSQSGAPLHPIKRAVYPAKKAARQRQDKIKIAKERGSIHSQTNLNIHCSFDANSESVRQYSTVNSQQELRLNELAGSHPHDATMPTAQPQMLSKSLGIQNYQFNQTVQSIKLGQAHSMLGKTGQEREILNRKASSSFNMNLEKDQHMSAISRQLNNSSLIQHNVVKNQGKGLNTSTF